MQRERTTHASVVHTIMCNFTKNFIDNDIRLGVNGLLSDRVGVQGVRLEIIFAVLISHSKEDVGEKKLK